jgi:hypothetical protein
VFLKKEIKQLRRKIYKTLKDKAQELEGTKSKEHFQYEVDQIKYSKREFQTSDIEELLTRVIESNVIYLGDFHTFDQNIRNVLRILKVLQQNENHLIIGLEMVDAKYQFYIDSYLENHITELEFLESIQYHDSWRFPWTHYNLIFEIAKKEGVKILALNTTGSLSERDDFAADIISKVLQRDIDTQILIVYGELHLSPDKIPQKVINLSENVTQTIIHQNLDEVYWKLLEDDQDDKIIRFNPEEFCINSAPPWIKYESMIYWYENLTDDPEFDIHEYIIENGKKIFGDDAYDNFLLMSEEMLLALRLKIDREELEDFNLFDHTRLEYIEDEVSNLPHKEIINFYKHLITLGYSFNLPGKSKFYCSSYSMNRLAYLAGIHIYHVYLDKLNLDTAEHIYSLKPSRYFPLFTFEAMYAYFFSKVINPHRKCNMYSDFYDLKKKSPKVHEVIDQTIMVLDGNNIDSIFKDKQMISVYETALNIGHILGEYLYHSIYNLSLKMKVESSFIVKSIDEKSFYDIKDLLLKDRDYKKDKKRYF